MELEAEGVSPTRRGRLMATVTQVYTVAFVAKLLDEDEEMLGNCSRDRFQAV